ncbi:MAG: FapA family protein, partial [Spirochaetaceae bacterium]
RTNPERLELTPAFQRALERHRHGQEIGPFRPPKGFSLGIVLSGAVIATVQEEIPGIDGVDVYNRPIPHGTLEVASLEPGEGTSLASGTLRAVRSGLLCMHEGRLWVEDTIHLREIGTETGDVRFPGNLVVEQRVQDGRRLWIGGDARVKATLDAHEVFVRGQLHVDGGIVGRGRALVRSGGGVQARFIEHCNVETKGSVQIQSLAYNSRIMALGSVHLAEGGCLIGGETRAAGRVEVPIVGNTTHLRTAIVVGINFVMERKLQYARLKHQDLTLMLQKLQRAMEQSSQQRARTLGGRIRKVQRARSKYANLMSDLLCHVDSDENAEIVVTKTVHPGTALQICRAKHTVMETLGPSRFYLDKDKGRIERADL